MTPCSIGAVRFAGCVTGITTFPYLAPLALLPLDIEDKLDLLLGQLDFSVWINVSSVASFLRGRGLLAEPFAPPESTRWFLWPAVGAATSSQRFTSLRMSER